MDPESQSPLDELRQARETDPRAGIRLGADSLVRRLIEALRDERGINADLLLLVLGSLAGYACQQTVALVAIEDGIGIQMAFSTVEGADGRRYRLGDRLRYHLTEGPQSVWRGVSSMATALGAQVDQLPNVGEIVSRVQDTVGQPGFAAIRYPAGHGAGLPESEQVLQHFWPQWRGDLEVYAPDPRDWPQLMTVAIRIAMDMAKGALAPGDAALIAMEAAVPMATVRLPDAA
ncbi:MAG: hypothetical protein LBL01_03635 [Bifidobacteriaceae bacterium]|jgi:hypothetical protein|nr:hypothetical protein [Bifidobacteriaceae bacterium]